MIGQVCSLTGREISEAVGGEAYGRQDFSVSRVSTDTRETLHNALFVALEGARFDAHNFLAEAIQGGASALLVSDAGWGRAKSQVDWSAVAVFVVPNTLYALGELARFCRRRWGGYVFGLTGSNGKTTTKEMLASILSMSRSVLKTTGNLNNYVGLPLTLLGLQDKHQVAVVEMGMNAQGEIARLTEIARPNAGTVLNVGPAHIGQLGSIEAIAAAKGELFENLTDGSVQIANADDSRVMRLLKASASVRTFGFANSADVCILKSEDKEAEQYLLLRVDGKKVECQLPFPGEHNARNAAAAVATATALSHQVPIELDDLADGLARTPSILGRQRVRKIGQWHVVDDTYNANRASMEAALKTVGAWASRMGLGFAVLLGEMRELGKYSQSEHFAVGTEAVNCGAKLVAAFGPMAMPIAEAAQRAGVTSRHEESDDVKLFEWLLENLGQGDVVLVKGSRGIRMERFIQRFQDEA